MVESASVPILTGMGAMTKMKLCVDFATGAAVFREFDPHSVRILPKTSQGHLVLDLMKDLSEQGQLYCKTDDLTKMNPELKSFHAVVKAAEAMDSL